MNESIRDQLEPLRTSRSSASPEVKPIVQITARLGGNDRLTAAEEGKATLLNWLVNKQGIRSIPQEAWGGASFEVDAALDRPVSVEATDSIWALRYDNPDSQQPGRIWRTEAVVGTGDTESLVGIRLIVISRTSGEFVYRTVPKVVSDLIINPGLQDYGIPLNNEPWKVETPEQIAKFIDLLENPRRSRHIYAASADKDGNFYVDTNYLAQRTAGLAHVVKLSGDASRKLASIVGRELAVFGGAVRTYEPGFERFSASFSEHPLGTVQWLQRRFSEIREFENLLALKAINSSVASTDLESALPSFTTIRGLITRRKLSEASDANAPDTELLKLYEQEHSSLLEQVETIEGMAVDSENQLTEAREENRDIKTQNFNLKQRIKFLESQHLLDHQPTADYPDSLSEIESWYTKRHGVSLLLLPRARRGAKKSNFADTELVYRSLELLATTYRSMRCGETSKEEFDNACASLGVEVSTTGDATTLNKWREEYEIAWKGKRRWLDLHLKKGVAHDPRTSLRIYFFWEEEDELVVIGSMTEHLTTNAS